MKKTSTTRPGTEPGFLSKTTRIASSLVLLAMIMLLPAVSVQGGVVFTNLVAFACTNGAEPNGPLFLAEDGSLYGGTGEGGAGNQNYCLGGGMVFQINSAGNFTILATMGTNDGNGIKGNLAKGGDGLLYGVTYYGGSSIWGTIFRLSESNTIITLHEFSGPDGVNPAAGLVRGVDGNLYGTTLWGGEGHPYGQFDGEGTVFRIRTNGVFSLLHSFNVTDGRTPAGLVVGGDGNLYGTTEGGGSYTGENPGMSFGTIFRIDGNGVFTSLFSFAGTNGYLPGGWLAYGSDGGLYGTTVGGGSTYVGSSPGFGTVFRFSPTDGLTTLHEFTGGVDGGRVWCGLMRANDGCFYGATSEGGAHGGGTLFRVSPRGDFSTLYSFTLEQAYVSWLTQGADGRLYAVSHNSGPFHNGNIFRVSVPMPPAFQSVEKSGDRLNVTWTSVAEQAYQLQYASTINSTNWTDLGDTITATNGTITVSDAVNEGKRFYRVVLLP